MDALPSVLYVAVLTSKTFLWRSPLTERVLPMLPISKRVNTVPRLALRTSRWDKQTLNRHRVQLPNGNHSSTAHTTATQPPHLLYHNGRCSSPPALASPGRKFNTPRHRTVRRGKILAGFLLWGERLKEWRMGLGRPGGSGGVFCIYVVL